MTAAEKRLVASIAAHSSWANTVNRSARRHLRGRPSIRSSSSRPGEIRFAPRTSAKRTSRVWALEPALSRCRARELTQTAEHSSTSARSPDGGGDRGGAHGVTGRLCRPASADIPMIPRHKLNVHQLKATATWNASGSYCTVRASAAAYWKKAPKDKFATVGHYIRYTIRVVTPAGYGGGLTKTIAKTTDRTETFRIPQVGLPKGFEWATATNQKYGNGEYAANITVRVIRDNSLPALDTTAWKGTYKTSLISGCNGNTS